MTKKSSEKVDGKSKNVSVNDWIKCRNFPRKRMFLPGARLGSVTPGPALALYGPVWQKLQLPCFTLQSNDMTFLNDITFLNGMTFLNDITFLNWPSTALVEKNAMFFVSKGLSLVNSGERLCGSDSPVNDELSTWSKYCNLVSLDHQVISGYQSDDHR